MTLGAYIKEKRIGKHMSQRELAAAARLSNAEISRIESGLRKQPSPDVLKSISSALNISYENLYAIAGYIDEKTDTNAPDSSDPFIKKNNYIYISDLTEEELNDVKKYIEFLKFKR